MITIKKYICLILAVLLLLGSVGCTRSEEETPNMPAAMVDPIDDNYRTFYQVFVGSFSDGNGDGIGDLRGLINRLDYLNDGNINSGKSLGVQGIWLSPIFTSPSYHKYDAKDYYEIDWRFGTEEDLKELIGLCHQRNIKLILDLVINHTSSQHPWFIQFKEARATGDTENPYYDYYTCVSTADKANGVTYQKIAGVDWWYECNFSGDMPELNYDNPTVRDKMLEVAKYYLDLGIDGFRFDAAKYIYYGDTGKSVEFWDWYMQELTAYCPDIYCVGECWSGETEILDYYSEKGRTVSKATLTKTIKPIYLDLCKTSPQKAKAVKSKLIKDYGYSSDTIDNWTTTKKEEKKDPLDELIAELKDSNVEIIES